MPGWPDQPEAVSAPDEAAIARARMLYEAAGYGRNRPLQVELRFNTSLTHRRMAAAVAAMWKQHLGVETRLLNEEWKVFVANRRHGRITEIVRGGWIADWRDAGNFLQLFMADSPLNYTFFNDPTFEFLMDSAAEQHGDQRLRSLKLAEAHLLDEHVILPLYYYVSRHLVHPTVRGFEDNAMDIHLSRWIGLE
jgi:oligopeptide transport system substrate-binding protein